MIHKLIAVASLFLIVGPAVAADGPTTNAAKCETAYADKTLETWRCVVSSMKEKGYPLQQAMTDCDVPQ